MGLVNEHSGGAGSMLTFIQLLEDLADTGRTIRIPESDLDRLVDRFGDRVRQMGRWNASSDGSLEVPVSVVREAAIRLGIDALTETVEELKEEQFTKALETSSAVAVIESIADLYRRDFRDLMTRSQETSDPAQAIPLRDQLVHEVFGE
jgi:hypothetical protein